MLVSNDQGFPMENWLWKHLYPGLVLDDLAGKETVRQSTMREVLKDTSGAINAAETWDFGETFQLFVLFVDLLHTCFAGLSQNKKVGGSYERWVTVVFFAIAQFWELPPKKKNVWKVFL